MLTNDQVCKEMTLKMNKYVYIYISLFILIFMYLLKTSKMGLKHHCYGEVKNRKRTSAAHQAGWAGETGGRQK